MASRHIGLGLFVTALLFATIGVQAADFDNDGVDDTVDDCIRSPGNSTIDRQGCPDRDGDGRSDVIDGVTIDTAPYYGLTSTDIGSNVYGVAFSPDGTLAAAGADNGNLRIYSLDTSQKGMSELGRTDINCIIKDLDWSPNGSIIGAACEDDDVLKIVDASTLQILSETSTDTGGDETESLAFSPNGTYVVVANSRSGNNGDGGVTLIDVTDPVNPNKVRVLDPEGNSQSYYGVSFSPDGNMLAISQDPEVYVLRTSDWSNARTINLYGSGNNMPPIHDVAWSPDGNMLAFCEGWGGQQSGSRGVRLTMYDYTTGTSPWYHKTTTSCYSTEFSPDGRQVAAGMSWYSTDGGKSFIFDTDAGTLRATLGPQCNSCNVMDIEWSLDAQYVLTAVADSDSNVDRVVPYKMPADVDGDTVPNTEDAFPTIPSQWDDSDRDGYGDNPSGFEPDACPSIWGNSTHDRFGCPDSDGDHYSDSDSIYTVDDGADAFPNDPEQWEDTDKDGYGDNYLCTWDAASLRCIFQAGDAFPTNPSQWNDTDDDGWGDNFANASWLSYRPVDWPGVYIIGATQSDALPLVRDQWLDSDGDLYGDNPDLLSSPRIRADACPHDWGDSWRDGRYGCPDADRDGYGDKDDYKDPPPDQLPDDPTQHSDIDGDGYGDNMSGNNPDDCYSQWGNSSIDRRGCIDTDGDGRSDPERDWTHEEHGADGVPSNPTQWEDADGDGYGDNASGTEYDEFGDDPTQWKDTDGDGYGDNYTRVLDYETGVTIERGDAFIFEPTQWTDFDGDRFGDNYDSASLAALGIERYCGELVCPGQNVLGAVNSDICPILGGQLNSPLNRGCADSDGDLVPDNLDPWPLDSALSLDLDNDGYADDRNAPRNYRDMCPDTPSNIVEAGLISNQDRLGCTDSDGDGWSDPDAGHTVLSPIPGYLRPDALPDDSTQWVDCDGDGYGDNWADPALNDTRIDDTSLFGERCDGVVIPELEDQILGQWVKDATRVDAFPKDSTQWLDSDGDGFGDNYGNAEWAVYWEENGWPGQLVENPYQPDRFPLDPTQWKDVDADGYGDNSRISVEFPNYDMCPLEWGNATERLYRGCPDLDGDGYADTNDGCPTDPEIHDRVCPSADVTTNQALESEGGLSGGLSGVLLITVGVLVLLIVSGIAVMFIRSDDDESNQFGAMDAANQVDEEERKRLWIEHYLKSGQKEEAKALGWKDPADRPVWQKYEDQQKAEIEAALPSMIDLDHL